MSAKNKAIERKKAYGTMEDIQKPRAVSRFNVRAKNWRSRIQDGNTVNLKHD